MSKMEDQNKEEFNSTEIKIEEIKETDRSDDWDVVSEFEADTYQVPYISVPKMRDFDEESGSAYETITKTDTQDKQGISSRSKQEQENERLKREMEEAMQELSIQHEKKQDKEQVEKETEEAMQDKSSHYKQDQETERLRTKLDEVRQKLSIQHEQEHNNEEIEKGIEEAMQCKSSHYKQDQETERVRTKLDEAMQELSIQHERDQDNKQVKKEMEEAKQDKSSHYKQDRRIERVRTELDEAMYEQLSQYEKMLKLKQIEGDIEEAIQENSPQDRQKQENESVVREMEEASQDSPSRRERESESVQRRGQSPGSKAAKQFKSPEKCPESVLQKKSDELISLEVDEAMMENIVTSSAARCSKSQIQTAAESESAPRAKEENENQVFQLEYPKTFEKLCSTIDANKCSKAEKVDKLGKESSIQICSKYSVSFRNVECDSPLPTEEEENKEMKESDRREKLLDGKELV